MIEIIIGLGFISLAIMLLGIWRELDALKDVIKNKKSGGSSVKRDEKVCECAMEDSYFKINYKGFRCANCGGII